MYVGFVEGLHRLKRGASVIAIAQMRALAVVVPEPVVEVLLQGLDAEIDLLPTNNAFIWISGDNSPVGCF